MKLTKEMKTFILEKVRIANNKIKNKKTEQIKEKFAKKCEKLHVLFKKYQEAKQSLNEEVKVYNGYVNSYGDNHEIRIGNFVGNLYNANDLIVRLQYLDDVEGTAIIESIARGDFESVFEEEDWEE